MEVTYEDIVQAYRRIREVAAPSPLVYSHELSRLTGGEVYLKLDNLLQPVGSFKLRGAYNLISGLSGDDRRRGLVAVSAGNHAQAVAFCAVRAGLDAVIFMPENTPRVKVENTRKYGVTVVLKGRDYDESSKYAHEYERESGRVFVHPFNDPVVIAGQGTSAIEIFNEEPGTELIVAPVGGGGLICGCSVVARALRPGCELVGVQPETSAPFMHSLRAGKMLRTPIGDSVADALTGEIVSEEFFEFFRSLVDCVIDVSEDEISSAIYWALTRHSQIVEGGAAAGIAALLNGKVAVGGRKTVVIVTGCGIDASRLRDIIARYGEQL